MVVAVLKVIYRKQKLKIIQYRSYKNFLNDVFEQELNKEILKVDVNNAELSEFIQTAISVFDKHTPKKQ